MRLLSSTLDRVAPSATVALTGRVAALKAEGRDVIGLGAGEPDFPTPEHIREAGKRAIDEGRTRYTAVGGVPELIDAVRAKFESDNDLAYGASEVMVCAGGKQVLYNALMATLDEGDEVVIPAPYWVSYPDMTRLAGGMPVIVETIAPDYRMTPDQLESAITDRTKWLILNSPGNPTGAGYDAEALGALAEVLMRHPRIRVISDDIYEHIVFDGFRFATLAQVEPRLKDRVLTVNGVSKAYAMTGWRIGYAGGPAELIGAMRKIQSQSTTNPCSISQWAAVEALEGPQDFLAPNAAMFQRRRDMVVDALNGCPGIDCPTPEGAFYVYPSIHGCIGKTSAGGRLIADDSGFAEALLEEEGVAVVHGAAFGASPAFRVSYAAADEVLKEAMARIARFSGGLN